MQNQACGARNVLIECHWKQEADALFADGKMSLAQRFGSISKWNSAQRDAKRLAWLKIHGVLLHAWNDQLFTAIALLWASVCLVDLDTSNKKNLMFGRVLIQMSFSNSIARTVELILMVYFILQSPRELAIVGDLVQRNKVDFLLL